MRSHPGPFRPSAYPQSLTILVLAQAVRSLALEKRIPVSDLRGWLTGPQGSVVTWSWAQLD